MTACARCEAELQGEGVENHSGQRVCSPREIYHRVGSDDYLGALVAHGILKENPDPGEFGRGIFVCGGRQVRQNCYLCSRPGQYQCDAFVSPPGTKPRRRCNRYVCAGHVTPLVPGKDACPEHKDRCLAALHARTGQALV